MSSFDQPQPAQRPVSSPGSRFTPAAPRFDQPGAARIGFADQLSIETPEQVALEFPIAGIGSRFVAQLLDQLLIFASFIALGLTFFLIVTAGGWQHWADSLAGKWFFAGLLFVSFLLLWGYFALFEAFWQGQTPGKRVMKLRVIKDAGRQITLFESLARNLLRAVDYLPGAYLTGVVTMLCNQRSKRLGDLVAGTIVIHERTDTQPLLFSGMPAQSVFPRSAFPSPQASTLDPWRPSPAAGELFPADAIARLTHRDLLLIETFFGRALDLPLDVRAAMAERIAGELATRMGVALPEGNPERALESVATGLRRQARRG